MVTLMEKLNQQEAKIKQLELTCDHQVTTIQHLNDTVSTQKDDIINLNSKLQEKEKLLNTWSNSTMNGYSCETEQFFHSKDYDMSSSSSQDSVASNDNFECGPSPVLIADGTKYSDTVQDLGLSPNMVCIYLFGSVCINLL